MMQKSVYTIQEAARELGLAVSTVRRCVRDRQVGYVRSGHSIHIPAGEIHNVTSRLVSGALSDNGERRKAVFQMPVDARTRPVAEGQ